MTASAEATAEEDGTILMGWDAEGAGLPVLGEDESYRLEITARKIELRAPKDTGVLRGLATLEQLLATDGPQFHLPELCIEDRPRFPWRGLMLDVCRHWIPPDVVLRQLDGMALAKLNVLHLHLTDDQGFRVESRTHPRLHECGSDGQYYTHRQLRDIVLAAAERGIRVLPEFDVPGHATAWLAGHPELAGRSGEYAIERRWGVHDAVLDPTNEAVYELLGAFLGEMADVFPDPFVHIGGDENNGRHWGANRRIQDFMAANGLADHSALQAWFNRRVQRLLAAHGRQIVGWDEVLHPDLPRATVVQSWRGSQSLADAARRGFRGLLSSGYYLDHCHPAAWHYARDPLPKADGLSPEECARVLGGEAAVWTEWISAEMLEGRIWPRVGAIAERLWSPREVGDAADLYRRLDAFAVRLGERGLCHEVNERAMLHRLAGESAIRPQSLETFASALAPIANYRRSRIQTSHTQLTPLTGLEDAVRPDSSRSRKFADEIEAVLETEGRGGANRDQAERALRDWRAAAAECSEGEYATVARALANACDAGLEALARLGGRDRGDAAWTAKAMTRLTDAGRVAAPVDIAILAPLRRLVAAVARPRGADTDWAAWRREVEECADVAELARRNLPPGA